MKIKELISILSDKDNNSEVILGVNNGFANTYGIVDRIVDLKFKNIYPDFYGTPGRMDLRLFRNFKDDDNLVFLDSYLDTYKYSGHVDYTTDLYDPSKDKLRDPGNGLSVVFGSFEEISKDVFRKTIDTYEIIYDGNTETLVINRYDGSSITLKNCDTYGKYYKALEALDIK